MSTSIVMFLLFLCGWLAYSLLAPDEKYLPTADNMALLLLVLLLANRVRNGYARYTFLLWAVWFVLGSVSLFAQNQRWVGLNYNIEASAANRLYLLCVLTGITGALMVQMLMPAVSRQRLALPVRGSSPVLWIALLAFPLLYGASIVLATGDIPLFSGRNVSSEMYEVEYGPLHGFGIFVAVACLFLWTKVYDPQSVASRSPLKLVVLTTLVVFLVVASFDGRRVMAIFGIVSLMLYYLALPTSAVRWVRAAVIGVLGLFGYVSAAAIRAGGTLASAFGTIYEPLATVGVEYRDYVYAFENVSRNRLLATGYDWPGSTFASLVPGFIAKPLGIDKAALVLRDSARTLMPFWNVELGIRIGLPGELWFAFGWFAVLAFLFFGAMVMGLAHLAARSQHSLYKAILVTLLSVWALSVLGQSTMTFGLILPLTYLAAAVAVVEWLMRRPAGGRRRRPVPVGV